MLSSRLWDKVKVADDQDSIVFAIVSGRGGLLSQT